MSLGQNDAADKFHSTIQIPPFLGVVVGNGLGFAVTACFEFVRVQTVVVDKGLSDGFGSSFGQLLIVFLFAFAVGVTGKQNERDVGVGTNKSGGLVELRFEFGFYDSLIKIEIDAQSEFKAAALVVNAHAPRSVGALVEVVIDAVCVAVERTTPAIDGHPCGRAGTLIEVIIDTVCIAVERAA
jgi:hypothetical protein